MGGCTERFPHSISPEEKATNSQTGTKRFLRRQSNTKTQYSKAAEGKTALPHVRRENRTKGAHSRKMQSFQLQKGG